MKEVYSDGMLGDHVLTIQRTAVTNPEVLRNRTFAPSRCGFRHQLIATWSRYLELLMLCITRGRVMSSFFDHSKLKLTLFQVMAQGSSLLRSSCQSVTQLAHVVNAGSFAHRCPASKERAERRGTAGPYGMDLSGVWNLLSSLRSSVAEMVSSFMHVFSRYSMVETFILSMYIFLFPSFCSRFC